jgi:hypothetical protein
MTGPRTCHNCDEPIADSEEAVSLDYTQGNSGPAWELWAHRAHANQVRRDPVAVRILASLRIRSK